MTKKVPLLDRVQHGYADNNGVKIRYASLGQGPLVVMIHGFPDFWYTWRRQMEGLSDQFQIVAVDLRGYNDSDKPKGVESYAMPVLAGDLLAVVRHLGAGYCDSRGPRLGRSHRLASGDDAAGSG